MLEQTANERPSIVTMETTAFLGLGSNLGSRKQNIRQAVTCLRQTSGIRVKESSSIYETAPIGGPAGQGKFLNACLEIETVLSPQRLLQALKAIERKLGRKRTVKWGPRVIDLDILLYGDRVIRTSRLTIPHPRLTERSFVLDPLAEIAADVVHPALKMTIGKLRRKRKAKSAKRKTKAKSWKNQKPEKGKVQGKEFKRRNRP